MSKEKKIPTPNFDSINPSLCVNAKIRRLHRLLNTAYQRKINAFGLRGSMLSILFIIGKRKNINQKSIADRLVLDQSTMSRDLKKLVNQGLVSVSKGSDPRHSELTLTNPGYALLEEITPVWENLHNSVEQLLGQHHLQQLDVMIDAVQSNLEQLK